MSSFCLLISSGFSQGTLNFGFTNNFASLSTSTLAFSPSAAWSETLCACESGWKMSPSFSFFCTRALSSCCLSGGNPMKRSPKFSIDIAVKAALSILAKASSSVNPLNKHWIASSMRSKSPQTLILSNPFAQSRSNCLVASPPPANPDRMSAQKLPNTWSLSSNSLNACSMANAPMFFDASSSLPLGTNLAASIWSTSLPWAATSWALFGIWPNFTFCSNNSL